MITDRDHPDLSPRERQIMELAAAGFTDAGIAHKLGISEATVNTYWGRIRSKLGPFSRTELVAVSLREQHEAALTDLKARYEAEITQAKNTERSSEALFREVLRNAPDAVLLVTEEGRIVFANELAARAFGYTPGEMTGIDLLRLIPERFRDAHSLHRKSFVANPEKRRMGEHLGTLALRKDGTEFAIAASLSATRTTNGTLITCVFRPVD